MTIKWGNYVPEMEQLIEIFFKDLFYVAKGEELIKNIDFIKNCEIRVNTWKYGGKIFWDFFVGAHQQYLKSKLFDYNYISRGSYLDQLNSSLHDIEDECNSAIDMFNFFLMLVTNKSRERLSRIKICAVCGRVVNQSYVGHKVHPMYYKQKGFCCFSCMLRYYEHEYKDTLSIVGIEESTNCVYFVYDGENHKIGYTKDFSKRLPGIQCGNPNKVDFVFAIKCDNPTMLELFLKKATIIYATTGGSEWRHFGGLDIKEKSENFREYAGVT